MDIQVIDGALYLHVSEDEISVVPLEALAAWSVLLGLSDEDTLAAILARAEPEPQTDDPEDQGWKALYENLADELQVEVETQVLATTDLTGSLSLLGSQTLSMYGEYGPALVLAQAGAITEDAQRTAQASLRGMDPLPVEAQDALQNLADDLVGLRDKFRQTLAPSLLPQ